jgi:hypothetical protein
MVGRRVSSAALRDLNPGYHRLGYNADSVERLVALTDEHADFVQVRPRRTVVAVLGKLEQHAKTQKKLGVRSASAKARA